MRTALLIGLVLMFWMACGPSTDPEAVPSAQDSLGQVSAPADSLVQSPAVDTQGLAHRLDSILGSFELKTQDFSFPTYYHKAWWGRYWIRDDALLAGTDTLGNLFLIGNSSVSSADAPFSLDSLWVTGRDWEVILSQPETEIEIMELGVAANEAKVYRSPQASEALRHVAEAAEPPQVRLKGTNFEIKFRLKERDQEAIREVVKLAALLKFRP